MSVEPKTTTWEDAVLWLRNQPDRHQLVLDAFYDDPLIDAAVRYYESDEWRAIAKLLEGRFGRALDVGAGRGIASYALARQGFEVTALEPDPSAVVGGAAIRKLAQDTSLAIDVVETFSEELPFGDASFDVVFARAVLHHMRDLDRACAEMHRVLKPGGIVVATREHVISRDSDLGTFLDQHPLHRLYGGEHAYCLERYIKALNTAGFERLDVLPPLQSPINIFPYTFETLREEVIGRLERKVRTPLWKVALGSDRVFRFALSVAGRFDNRPGRLYSFVGHKAAA